MPVVTEEQYAMMVEVERIAINYSVPRSECLALIKMGFEAGQKDGLTALATRVMGTGASVVV